MKAGNGSLYDAKLGRFLSPDNFVQDPYNTQSFNRYGYVVNNPLSFSDESGEFILAAVLIGALINMTTAAIQGKSIGQVLLAGAIGAAAGIIGGGFANLAVGGAFFGNAAAGVIGFGQGFIAGAVGGFAGGFVGGAGNAWMNGASFGDGLGAGFKTGLIGGATGGLMGGITGGIQAHKVGLDFWNGDIVKDAAKLNNLFKSDLGAVACTDCTSTGTATVGNEGMFQNGESLRDFKADLTSSDDFGQTIKAFKKAYIYGGKYESVINLNNVEEWHKNGWHYTGFGSDLHDKSLVGEVAWKDFSIKGNNYRLTWATPISNKYSSIYKIAGLNRNVHPFGSHIYMNWLQNNGTTASGMYLSQFIIKQDGSYISSLTEYWWNYMTK